MLTYLNRKKSVLESSMFISCSVFFDFVCNKYVYLEIIPKEQLSVRSEVMFNPVFPQ